MPSPASQHLPGAASTPVTRTPSRCGTGPVAASATTAGAAGGPTTTTSSPPPSSDAHPLRSTHTAALNPCGLACRAVESGSRHVWPGEHGILTHGQEPAVTGPSRSAENTAVTIGFRPLSRADLPLLKNWLRATHGAM